MSYVIDDEFLESVGIHIEDANVRAIRIAVLQDEIERRVGEAIVAQLTDKQLDEFEEISDAGNEAESLAWLEENFPEYPRKVASIYKLMKAELKAKKV